MSSMTGAGNKVSGSGDPDSSKSLIDRGKESFARLRERRPSVDHLVRTIERYNDRRGNVFAAAISFNGILALVPIVMVAFAIAAFVLVGRPDLIDQIKDSIVEAMPGELGTQVEELVDSAIASRTTVGVVGLLGAAFTGIGWIGGVRIAMTEMWGGRVERNAVMSKVWDLLTFVLLGLAFVGTFAITAVGNGALLPRIVDWLGLEDQGWVKPIIKLVTILVSIGATWMLFTFVLSRLPLNAIPFRNALKAGLITALIFELVKNLGGIYLQSVLSGPAGAAFGPILGVMVFAYLASRIILYASAWCATDPINADHEIDDTPVPETVVLRPSYVTNPTAKPSSLLAAAGIGAVFASLLARFRKRR